VTAAFTDPSLCSVMEARTSGRDHDAHSPVSLAELGGFLFRCARVRGTYVNEAGQFTTRPYPSGGGSYELEVYVTVNQCAGLGRGLYYYDPALHVLSPVAGACADVEELLNDAWRSAALTCRPQILITVSSRFHRVGWKYSSISYATQLKNTGVLLQTFYLVATAMGLAGCALGLGNIERFARLTKLDPMAEGSVGEFMLGSSSAPSALRA
jgi:SagB-type dehydrogenase family enzyme